jgi:excinuclease ABC subunit A
MIARTSPRCWLFPLGTDCQFLEAPAPEGGLHFADIDRLLQSLNRLVDNGHSVVVIEHNLDVIKTADYVIDLGPEGGHNGGRLIACGTPEEIAASKASHTGKFLAELLPN